MKEYDILIVGGGMVGLTLACALGDSALRIAVIEPVAAEPRQDLPDYDLRVSALTRSSEQVFRAIGAWDAMVRSRVSPYQRMQVWDSTGHGQIRFDAAEIGEPNLGHIVENRVIMAALQARLAEFDNLTLYCPATVGNIHRDDEQVRLTLQDGRRLFACLVVGTDGADSQVRREAGIETVGWSYQQSAVVATIQTELSHRHTCWQCFMPQGPLAFLPLADEQHSSIVWSTAPAHAAELMALPEPQFLAALSQAFGGSLGVMQGCGPRGVFPLSLRHAKQYTAPRLALAGNAAHAIHPLAGQGLNLGISDAAALAEILLEAKRQGRDIGAWEVLRRYERWRKGDNLAVMVAMDGFKRLFGNTHPLLAPLRNLGLQAVDRLGPLKSLLIRQAMGMDGERPRLCRGMTLG